MDKDKIIPTLAELLEMNYEDIDESAIYVWRHSLEDPYKSTGWTPGSQLKLMKEISKEYNEIVNKIIWGNIENKKDNE